MHGILFLSLLDDVVLVAHGRIKSIPNLITALNASRPDLLLRTASKSMALMTFALVTKMTTARTIFSVATTCQWLIFQMDGKNAILNGLLKEEL